MKQFVVFIAVFGFFSCKEKEEPMYALDGDKSIFVGKWNWIYTSHKYNICTGDPPLTEILTPETEESNYSAVFFKEGLVKYYENGNEIGNYRLIFDAFDYDGCSGTMPNYYTYYISLDGDDSNDKRFQGCVRPDTLYVIRGFPFMNYEELCESYLSYFVKE